MRAVVIGNGESRLNISITNLPEDFVKIGCNAIHRDILVDHLICCDKRMVEESLQNLNYSNKKIYTRDRNYLHFKKILKAKNIFPVPSLPYSEPGKVNDPTHWGSGPFAVLLAGNLDIHEIYLVGFDLHGNNYKINNVYKDTKNYSNADHKMVDPSFWIHQIGKVFLYHPNKNFYIINNDNWQMPKPWNHKNVFFQTIEQFNVLTLNTESV